MQQDVHNEHWASYEKLTFRFLFVYVLCFMSCISFPHSIIPDIGRYTNAIWQPVVAWFAKSVLRLSTTHDLQLNSDSTGMYVAAALIIIIAVTGAIMWTFFDKRRHNYNRLYYWFRAFISYYLALQLMVYGADKIFKTQFYLPEPNTLYTALGAMPRDLLYWSTMGISRPYSIFLGSVEIVCVALLLFCRTRRAGALLSAFVLVNIVAINLCFDISVKLYSLFLLLLAVVLLCKYPSTLWRPVYATRRQSLAYIFIKSAVVVIMVTDVIWSYARTGTFNDDTAPRPYLHGAYHVALFIRNNDTLPPLETDEYRWRRMFIHRRGYLVVQHMNDDMQDHVLTYDTANRYLMISDAHDKPHGLFHYGLPNDTTLELHGNVGTDSVDVYLHSIDEHRLRLLNEAFHWRSDE